MIQESDKDFIMELLRRSMIVITPWKKNVLEHSNPDWAAGWNDCVKEMIKTRKKYLAHMDKEVPKKK